MAHVPPRTAPCGGWISPITTDLLTQHAVRLGASHIGRDGSVYWIEGRPAERGRYVLVRRDTRGMIQELTPAPLNVRTTVHEYGGGAHVVDDNEVWFVDHPGNQLHHIAPTGSITALTPPASASADWRLADLQVDRKHARIICVGEHHHAAGDPPTNAIVTIPLGGGSPQPLVTGADFYSSPRLSPQGDRLCWLQWYHPDMPWDAATLQIAAIDREGNLSQVRTVAGNERASVFGPGFMASGDLVFMFENNGFWNPHVLRVGQQQAVSLVQRSAEFALPLWQFGMSTWGEVGPDRIACVYTQRGQWFLCEIDTRTAAVTEIESPYTAIGDLHARNGRIVMVASAPDRPSAVVEIDSTSRAHSVLRQALQLDATISDYVSAPEPVSFEVQGGETAHAFFYPPRNADFVATDEEKPPLIVTAHGGPTSAVGDGLNLGLQFWTSRGFAVLDVNYRGSTGFGRAYRDRLRGGWGILDVEDCVAGALSMVKAGRVDGDRMAIRGGSAGGYTVLAALAFRDVFHAGASHYGVGDLAALVRDTHKFEARYLDRLVAPYPERADIYEQRSPLAHADRIRAPVIFFQGLEDRVVPPAQAEAMMGALKGRGIPCAYLAFAGEQHGFRQAETIRRVLESELYFYGRIFNFTPNPPVPAVEIENLPGN